MQKLLLLSLALSFQTGKNAFAYFFLLLTLNSGCVLTRHSAQLQWGFKKKKERKKDSLSVRWYAVSSVCALVCVCERVRFLLGGRGAQGAYNMIS